jgi:hypothetical protein
MNAGISRSRKICYLEFQYRIYTVRMFSDLLKIFEWLQGEPPIFRE